jgi:hypothetical protein
VALSRPAADAVSLGYRNRLRVLKLMGGSKKSISTLPFAGGWADTRDMPAPSGKTFRELYRRRIDQ